MRRTRRNQRGMLLFLSLVIAFIMMLWVVAATHRANFQTAAAGFSYRKSEAYYLAKRAANRSLNALNQDNGWVTAHTGRANADTSTPDTLCWIEVVGTDKVLRCEAKVNWQTHKLSVPLLEFSDTDTHIYSISPSRNGGSDLIAWTTIAGDEWETLPPVPGESSIDSIAPAPNGDVFAIVGGGTSLWRYRPGQGWIRMPDAPSGVQLSQVSTGGGSRVVVMGSNNTLMTLPLDASLVWDVRQPPRGTTITNLHTHPGGADYSYATLDLGLGSRQGLAQFNHQSSTWSSLPLVSASDGGSITNFSGGLAVDTGGRVFAASNNPGEPSAIFKYEPTTPGATTGTWTELPPVPALQWVGGSPSVNGFATDLRHLRADDRGKLWVQWTDPSGTAYSVIELEADPP